MSDILLTSPWDNGGPSEASCDEVIRIIAEANRDAAAACTGSIEGIVTGWSKGTLRYDAVRRGFMRAHEDPASHITVTNAGLRFVLEIDGTEVRYKRWDPSDPRLIRVLTDVGEAPLTQQLQLSFGRGGDAVWWAVYDVDQATGDLTKFSWVHLRGTDMTQRHDVEVEYVVNVLPMESQPVEVGVREVRTRREVGYEDQEAGNVAG